MIILGNRRLSVNDFEQIIFKQEKIQLDEVSLAEVDANFNFLKAYSQNKIIYGINTGLGPMSSTPWPASCRR